MLHKKVGGARKRRIGSDGARHQPEALDRWRYGTEGGGVGVVEKTSASITGLNPKLFFRNTLKFFHSLFGKERRI